MRVAELAKITGLTTQELRHELAAIDFGVKPTDKEIPDSIASGIMRYLSSKYKDRIKLDPNELMQKYIESQEEKFKESKEPQENEDEPTKGDEDEIEEEVSTNEEKEEKVEKKTKNKEEDKKDEKKKKKLVQTIDSIKFFKPKKVEKPKKEHSKGKKSEQKDKKAPKKRTSKTIASLTPIKEEGEKTIEVSSIESHALKKQKTQTPIDKGRKRVRITHKLTLDDVQDSDITTVEEERITEEMEREIFRKQKKIKSKSTQVKKEDKEQIQIKKKTGVVELPEIISVKEFAEKTGVQIPKIISELMKNGIMATINQQIDFETAALIASEFDVEVKKALSDIDTEDLLSGDLEKLLKDEKENLKTRPPIVTVMGHVDHGKTKLLDTIRDTNIVAKESGGITQHIGAYQIEYKKKKITFIDTPGHESFTAMRARGAKVTDIAILVVAADEGMKPQTIEAMNHAKEAKVPIIVAMNKIDKPNANIDKVKGELAEHELVPEDWGGKTICVPVSALENQNIDQLLEMVLLVAEMEDLKGNSNRPAVGTVIETNLDPSLGPIATIIINTGSLKIMDNVVIGETIGRIKSMSNSQGDKIRKAGPSAPVQIAGLNTIPHAGDILQVTKDEKSAKERISEIKRLKSERMEKGNTLIMQEIISRIQAGKLQSLKIVLKADTKGSLEAITQSLAKIESNKVVPKVIHSAVGGITESDVMMAAASQAIVIGFNVLSSAQVFKQAEREGVEIKLYQVIYDLINDVKKLLLGLVEPEIEEVVTGKLLIKEIFFSKKKKTILGGKITNGYLVNKGKLRVFRNDEEIGKGTIGNLKKVHEDVKEIKEGNECGIEFEGNVKPEEGDILECFILEEKKATL